MIKSIAIAGIALLAITQSNTIKNLLRSETAPVVQPAPAQQKSIYDFKVESLDGGTIDFAAFKGKKILVVNTASKCGYTPQYEELEKLYQTYKDRLVVVGFPANNFLSQEPGTNAQIKEFCTKNYGVTFPMAAKISVKGDDTAPIYKWLCNKSENGVLDATIKWNFNKFLIDENGTILDWYPSKVTPMSTEITSKL
ncbi:MAG: glutathione peroxidase [Ferruginibacter sp.]